MNTLKPYTIFALFLMISFSSAGQKSGNTSEIVFYAKPDFIAGNLSQVRFKVKENQRKIFNLKVNNSEIAMVVPGLKTFSVSNLWKRSFTLDVKSNHKYLVEIKSTLFRPKIRLVSEKEIL